MHNNTHRTHRPVCEAVAYTTWYTTFLLYKKYVQRNSPNSRTGKTNTENQRWERDRNDISQFIKIFCSSFNCLPGTTSIWVVGYIKALTNWKVSIVCVRYVIYIYFTVIFLAEKLQRCDVLSVMFWLQIGRGGKLFELATCQRVHCVM